MYTTKEAAQRLGISMRRVNALVASGDLEAQRFGRSWMLDERSVHERAERGRTAGRPKMNEKNERNLAPFTLMNRNHPISCTTDARAKRPISCRAKESPGSH